MSKSHRLELVLDRPESGWLRVELSFGEQKYSFCPSYTPYDSISELVYALLKILQGYDETVVRWNDEPVEHEFVFELRGEQVGFRVYLINETVIGKVREQVFMFSGTKYEVIWPIWKAIRDMQSRQSLEEYEREWRPFPKREMNELTKRVKEMKEIRSRNKAV